MEVTESTTPAGQTRRGLLGRLGLVVGGIARAMGYAAGGA
jgi:hypothetical protein